MINRIPFLDLRNYWLSNARVRELLSYDPNKNTFVPAHQSPEDNPPFVRYTVRDSVGQPQYWYRREDVALGVYMYGVGNSTELINLFIDMAGEEDHSAMLMNRWLAENGGSVFDFKSMKFLGGADIEPPTEEGGSHIRPVTFSMQYVIP